MYIYIYNHRDEFLTCTPSWIPPGWRDKGLPLPFTYSRAAACFQLSVRRPVNACDSISWLRRVCTIFRSDFLPRVSDRISSSWAHGYFPVGRADLRVSRTLEMDPNFSSVQKISFYIVSYFLPNLACSRPLGTHTHTHTHVHIRTDIIHCCRYQLSLLPKPADFPALLEQGKAFSNTGIGGVLERFPRLWDSDLAYDSWQWNPNWVNLVQEGTNAANVLQISNGKVQQVLNHTPLNPTSFPAYCTVSRHAHA